jgi:phage gp36-like protein
LYSAQADILLQISDVELAQLTSDDGVAIDGDVVDKAITDADADIDSYLGKVYSVPLSTTPAKVNQLSVTIALYKLHSRRAAVLGGVSEVIRTNYEDAIRFLEQAAAGKVTIGIDPPPPKSSTTGGKFNADDRRFKSEDMEGY